MGRVRAAALVGLVVGCAAAPPRPDPTRWRNCEGLEYQCAIADEVGMGMSELIPLDLSRVDLYFVYTFEEQRDACGGFAGCTVPEVNGYSVHTYLPETWTEGNAQVLAHELCHVSALENGDPTGDPTHTWTDCFDRVTGYSAMVAKKVASDNQH